METIEIHSLRELLLAAELILERSGGKGVVAFYGGMGAGKTTLIREICAQLGVADNVASPTFAIVNQYMTDDGNPIYHFDFYRIDKVEEAFDMGYEEYFYSGDLCLVEWPEKVEQLMPDDTMRVSIEVTGDNSRRITLTECEKKIIK